MSTEVPKKKKKDPSDPPKKKKVPKPGGDIPPPPPPQERFEYREEVGNIPDSTTRAIGKQPPTKSEMSKKHKSDIEPAIGAMSLASTPSEADILQLKRTIALKIELLQSDVHRLFLVGGTGYNIFSTFKKHAMYDALVQKHGTKSPKKVITDDMAVEIIMARGLKQAMLQDNYEKVREAEKKMPKAKPGEPEPKLDPYAMYTTWTISQKVELFQTLLSSYEHFIDKKETKKKAGEFVREFAMPILLDKGRIPHHGRLYSIMDKKSEDFHRMKIEVYYSDPAVEAYQVFSRKKKAISMDQYPEKKSSLDTGAFTGEDQNKDYDQHREFLNFWLSNKAAYKLIFDRLTHADPDSVDGLNYAEIARDLAKIRAYLALQVIHRSQNPTDMCQNFVDFYKNDMYAWYFPALGRDGLPELCEKHGGTLDVYGSAGFNEMKKAYFDSAVKKAKKIESEINAMTFKPEKEFLMPPQPKKEK
jgi:hypothetical protein